MTIEKQLAHQMPITPPHSSRLSFAQLPSPVDPSSSTSHPFGSLGKIPTSFDDDDHDRQMTEYDEDEYDDDEEEGTERDGDSDPQRCEVDMPEQYDRLASLRERSPSGILLFSSEDPDFDVLEVSDARETEAALVQLASPISSALTQYRALFDRWEEALAPPSSVLKASILIDQCLAKFVYSLEPLKEIITDLSQFNGFMQEFHAFLSNQSALDHQHLKLSTQLWNGLTHLEDKAGYVDEALSDLSEDIDQLCDWVDGFLTPALAEVKFPTRAENEFVGEILDVHSFLCEGLVKSCSILKIYSSCFKRIGCSLQSFQSILISNDLQTSQPHPHRLDLPQLQTWAKNWADSLVPITNALSVFRSISDCIQFFTCAPKPPKSPSSTHGISY